MTRIYVAAGALLLGTSTLAWAADSDKTPMAAKATAVGAETAKIARASIGKATTWDETSWAGEKAELATKSHSGDAKVEMASLATKPDVTDPKDELALLDKDLAPLAMAEAKPGSWAGKVEPGHAGMGGPEVDADLTPRVSTENYPPCSPGPGDDRCIQLYERGVRADLARWNPIKSGLADNSVTTAVGGPYEPVEADKIKVAVDSGLENKIETVDVDTGLDVTSHNDSQGVGGPVEAQSGYPPCSPGEGDDGCIQLYERGVTGAGN